MTDDPKDLLTCRTCSSKFCEKMPNTAYELYHWKELRPCVRCGTQPSWLNFDCHRSWEIELRCPICDSDFTTSYTRMTGDSFRGLSIAWNERQRQILADNPPAPGACIQCGGEPTVETIDWPPQTFTRVRCKQCDHAIIDPERNFAILKWNKRS